MNHKFPAVLAGFALAGFALGAQAASFSEGFDGAALPAGWVTTNLSDAADTPWSTASAIDTTGPFAGAGFAAVDYSSTSADTGNISNWLISPVITGLRNGDSFSFYTTTVPGSSYPDRLEFRLSTAGASTNVGSTTSSVGDFGITLATVNGGLALGGYPETWTRVTVTLSGITSVVDGRVAFRYNVPDSGVFGDNGNVIGVDSFSYVSAAPVPEAETWMMMIGGLGALVALRRGKRAA